MFLQIHYLTNYHASLLNRDDAGLAKRIPFGGVTRLRISSQCQKRHWREWMADRVDLPRGIRTRYFFARTLLPRVVSEFADLGVDEERARGLVFALGKALLTAAGEKSALDKDTLVMKQPVLFGQPEADFMITLLRQAIDEGGLDGAEKRVAEIVKEGKKNVKAMLQQAGLKAPEAGFEGALFGRFVTSDVLARVDAPVHVAHAFTTHGVETEVDFFTVVDDLARDEETGAAHANDMELGAGTFYGYVAIDLPLLISNLTGCVREAWRENLLPEARRLLEILVDAIAQVTPGAKLGATAPYARAEFVALELGSGQPRSLANAFLDPVSWRPGTENPVRESVVRLADYLGALEAMYGTDDVAVRRVATLHSWPREEELAQSLSAAVHAVLGQVFGEV